MYDMGKRAKLRALHILTRMDRSEEELRRALKKSDYTEEVVEDAIEYVKSYGYIDDEKYAINYIRCHQDRRSILRIKYELSKKGVSTEAIQNALLEAEETDEKKTILLLVRKKWKSEEKPNEKELRRIFGYLARQGFKSHDIWSVLREENLT